MIKIGLEGLTHEERDLVEAVVDRFRIGGPEVLFLKCKLLLALIGAAELAGDKDEARRFARQHTELCRARARAQVGGR